jgi:3-oxoacyl-[acyl-carrier protein] reductase
MDLNGKTIVTTGAAQGLGRGMAREVARHGAKMALVDLQKDNLDEAVRLCLASGGDAKGYPTDVTDEAAVEALFASDMSSRPATR